MDSSLINLLRSKAEEDENHYNSVGISPDLNDIPQVYIL